MRPCLEIITTVTRVDPWKFMPLVARVIKFSCVAVCSTIMQLACACVITFHNSYHFGEAVAVPSCIGT